MDQIAHIHAREVYDSRGRPTVEVEIRCQNGAVGSAIVPSGASTGTHEALELRDRDSARLGGLGVRTAVANINTVLAPDLCGLSTADQERIDQRLRELDGTADKSRLGANAILGVSLAAARAASAVKNLPLVEHLRQLWDEGTSHYVLPLPMINMISGGLHAGGNLDFQDFLILPVGASSFAQAMEWTVTVYGTLGRLLRDAGHEGTLVGDEGGYGPRLDGNEAALAILARAIETAGYRPGVDVGIGLDVASTHFYREGRYHVDNRELTAADMVAVLCDWCDRYPILSIEDALAEEDWDGWRLLTGELGDRVQLIGDDLFVTNANRLRRGIDEKTANSILIKLNQIGTLSETFETLRLAKRHGYAPVISARSGETEDAFIADLAVATNAGQIKIGSVVRSERLAKYNQLLRLEERLGDRAVFAGASELARTGKGDKEE